MELNESSLIENELTLRNLKLPKEVLETRRSTARWLALSLGIINPGESRLSAVAVLDALVHYRFVKNADPTIEELKSYITANWEDINEKTLRYHLLRMKNIGILENEKGRFYLRQDQRNSSDPDKWISFILEEEYGGIAKKIGEAIRELQLKGEASR